MANLIEKVDKFRDFFSTRDEDVAERLLALGDRDTYAIKFAKRLAAAEAEREKILAIIDGPERLRSEAFAAGLEFDQRIGAIENKLRAQKKLREQVALEALVGRVRAALQTRLEAIEERNSVNGARRIANLDAFKRRDAVTALVVQIERALAHELPLLSSADIRERCARYRQELEMACEGDEALEKVLA